MAKFRKQSIVIDAVQVQAAKHGPKGWDGDPFSEIPIWLNVALIMGKLSMRNEDRDYVVWEIDTHDGTMRAEPGDWIIYGVKGGLCPCKNEIFKATYELVE